MSSEAVIAASDQARRHFSAGEANAAERLLREHLAEPECVAALREYLVAEGRVAEALELARMHSDAVGRALDHHAAGRFDAAAQVCRAALMHRPDDGCLLLHYARALHNLGRCDEAIRALERTVTVQPEFAEGWYALAHALRASGRMDDACRAYAQSLQLSPGLRSAYLNLGITRLAVENAGGALECFETLLARNARDIEALLNSGVAFYMLGDLQRAGRRLRRALELLPDHPDAHRFLGAVCNEAGQTGEALEHLRRALRIEPENPDLYAELAGIYEQAGRLAELEHVLAQGIPLAPEHPRLNLEAARLERRRKHVEQALARLGRLQPESLPPRLAQQVFQETGLCLDRLDRADDAFRAFEAANRVAAVNPRARAIDRRAYFDRLDRLARWLEQAPAGTQMPGGDDGRDLCFLVGFPRSGTTLLDAMLDAHPDVSGIDEKPTLERVVDRLSDMPGGYPAALARLDTDGIRELQILYRRAAAEYLPGPAVGVTVDKMPMRLLDAGLIRRLFPAARVLCVRRHPCDVVLSNFMQLFEPSEALVHCDTLAGAVRLYDSVMQLWPRLAGMLGTNLINVRYEELVNNPRRELERVCQFLGIVLHQDLLDTQKRAASLQRIRTCSYQQVGEPLYRHAAGRWMRYRHHLVPYLPVLRRHAQAMDYALDAMTPETIR